MEKSFRVLFKPLPQIALPSPAFIYVTVISPILRCWLTSVFVNIIAKIMNIPQAIHWLDLNFLAEVVIHRPDLNSPQKVVFHWLDLNFSRKSDYISWI